MNGLAKALQRLWWHPGGARWATWPLRPIAWLGQRWAGHERQRQTRLSHRAAVPVLVVGNLIVGGAGKTPTTIALVQALRARGWHPGVVSRGHGRLSDELVVADASANAAQIGDEPLLIHRRTGVPLAVATDRGAAAQALLAAHPEVDLVIADDGLQHWRLQRDWQVIVFDSRGIGNGLTLPAGPLRQPFMAAPPARSSVLYNAPAASTPWPGHLAARRLGGALPLSAWWAGEPVQPGALPWLASASQQRPVLAAAGLAEPERFFAMLEAAGVRLQRCPLPDHAPMLPQIGRAHV